MIDLFAPYRSMGGSVLVALPSKSRTLAVIGSLTPKPRDSTMGCGSTLVQDNPSLGATCITFSPTPTISTGLGSRRRAPGLSLPKRLHPSGRVRMDPEWRQGEAST